MLELAPPDTMVAPPDPKKTSPEPYLIPVLPAKMSPFLETIPFGQEYTP